MNPAPAGSEEHVCRPAGAEIHNTNAVRWRRCALATGYPLLRLRRTNAHSRDLVVTGMIRALCAA